MVRRVRGFVLPGSRDPPAAADYAQARDGRLDHPDRPLLAPAAVGPRAARSRRIATALAAADRRVHPVAIADPTISEPVLRNGAGNPGRRDGEPGLSAHRRLRATSARRPAAAAAARCQPALGSGGGSRDPALAEPPSPRTTIYAIAAPFSALIAGLLARR